MALSRSASGPGGLSINTNSANSLFGTSSSTTGGMFGNKAATTGGSLFGAPASAAPATGGGLFDNTATTSQPATGGLFGSSTPTTQAGGLFGSTPASQPQQTGGLFGNTATTQPATGGLFGSSTSTAQPAAGGLFGSTATSQPAATSGIFGGLGQQTPASGGLFGGAKPAAQTSGLFGSSTQTGGGLFGGQNNQTSNQTSSTPSLFGGLGSNQTNQPQAQSSFGATQNQTGLFGNTLSGGMKLGQSANQQQTVPGVRIDISNIRGTSRFNDLHEELQKEIEKIDDVLMKQMETKRAVDSIMPAHDAQLAQVPTDVEFCSRKLLGAKAAADSDVHAIAIAKKQIEIDAENFRLSWKAIDNLRLPTQYHMAPGMWNQKYGSTDTRAQQAETEEIVGYFSKTVDELSSTLTTYQKTITDIEQHLRGVEANSAQQINAMVAQRNGNARGEENPFLILTGVLNEFEQTLLGVASKVGAAREGVQRLELGNYGASPAKQKNGRKGGLY